MNGEMLWTVTACPSYWHGKDKIGDPDRDTATEWYEGSMMMENGRVKDGLLQMKVIQFGSVSPSILLVV